MFFQNKQKEAGDKTKKRSVLGLLFNPQVGREIAPLKESAAMFVRMIALIFASFNLFPKDHPAFNDASIRLTTMGVIRTAFQGLSFTREGAPQVAVFVAVTGCLLFSALFVLTLLLSLFIGPAHAEDIFVSDVTKTDWAIQWINYIFLGEPMKEVNAGSTVAPPEGNTVQIAMGQALSFYSTAVLALAGFLLLYHLVFMVAEAAQTGKPMGRANQVWAPIRLVFAIGMLVPIGAGGDGGSVVGYNTGQYVSMQIGRWGSGLASNIWSRYMTSLDTELSRSYAGCPEGEKSQNSPSCIKMDYVAYDIIKGLITADACSYIMKHYLDAVSDKSFLFLNSNELNKATMKRLADIKSETQGKHLLSLETPMVENFGASVNLKEFCGGYAVPLPIKGPYSAVFTAQAKAVAEMITDVTTFVNNYAKFSIQGKTQDSALRVKALKDAGAAYVTAVKKLHTNLSKSVEEALSKAGEAVAKEDAYNMKTDYYRKAGWLMAGAWYNQVSNVMAMRSGSVSSATPTILPPSLGASGEHKKKNVKDVLDSTYKDYISFISFLNQAIDEARGTSYEADFTTPSGSAKRPTYNPVTMNTQGWLDTFSNASPVNILFRVVDFLGIAAGVWNDGGLAVQFGATLNPIAELSSFGQNAVKLGNIFLSVGATASSLAPIWGVMGGAEGLVTGGVAGMAAGAIAGFTLGKTASAFLEPLSGVLFFLAGIMYLVGFTMGFIIPLYPFYRFFFGSLQWLMSVFQAIVLAPLFALAHVNPYGEGLAGQYGKYGYSVLMQILLRPVLMVFGLIAGYLIFGAALHFMNEAFIIATRGVGGYSGGGLYVISKILYSIIYCAFVFILANQCFSTIGLFPQVALQYLGMTGIKEENIGNTNMLEAGAAYVGKTILMDKLPGLAKAPGAIAAQKAKERKEKKDEDSAAEAGALKQKTLEQIRDKL